MSFTPTDIKLTISAVVTNAERNVEAKEAGCYRDYSAMYEMNPTWLFKTVKTCSGQTHKILGLSTRARKMPVIAERAGKVYKVPTAVFRVATLVG